MRGPTRGAITNHTTRPKTRCSVSDSTTVAGSTERGPAIGVLAIQSSTPATSQDVPGANVKTRSPRGVASQRSSPPRSVPGWNPARIGDAAAPTGQDASTASTMPMPNQSRYAGSHSMASCGNGESGPWAYVFQTAPARMSTTPSSACRRARARGVRPPSFRPRAANSGNAR